MSDNEWTRPAAPPGPLFFNKKERDAVKQINDEVIERVVAQSVLYYAVDPNYTEFHPVYGEAIEKTFLPPIRVYALVAWDGIKTNINKYADAVQEIKVGFHKRRLIEDQNLTIRLGDFIAYGESYYEIVDLTEDHQLFGQIDQKFQITATCIRAREGTFDAS